MLDEIDAVSWGSIPGHAEWVGTGSCRPWSACLSEAGSLVQAAEAGSQLGGGGIVHGHSAAVIPAAVVATQLLLDLAQRGHPVARATALRLLERALSCHPNAGYTRVVASDGTAVYICCAIAHHVRASRSVSASPSSDTAAFGVLAGCLSGSLQAAEMHLAGAITVLKELPSNTRPRRAPRKMPAGDRPASGRTAARCHAVSGGVRESRALAGSSAGTRCCRDATRRLQQIRAHPRARKTSWMSSRISQRIRGSHQISPAERAAQARNTMWSLTGAEPALLHGHRGNRHDVTQLLPLLDEVPPIRGLPARPRRKPRHLHAYRGYAFDKYRRLLWKRGIKPMIARRGVAHGSGPGKFRWDVERAFAWLHQFKRLRIRYERRADPQREAGRRSRGRPGHRADRLAESAADICGFPPQHRAMWSERHSVAGVLEQAGDSRVLRQGWPGPTHGPAASWGR